MNSLLLGTADKTDALLNFAEPGFLLIDDGPVADAFAEQFTDATIFNPRRHSFSTARDYKSVRDFADILYSHGYGEQTLTVRNGRRTIAKLLLDNTTPLHKIDGDRKDPAIAEALGMLDELFLSPVLKRVLTRKPNFSFSNRSVIARIDRAELGDLDAFVLALLLIGQIKGQVILPDGGFYLRPLHMSLIRQERLVCGVSYLSQLGQKDSVLRQAVLGIKDKTGRGCNFDDAAIDERVLTFIMSEAKSSACAAKSSGSAKRSRPFSAPASPRRLRKSCWSGCRPKSTRCARSATVSAKSSASNIPVRTRPSTAR